VPGGYWWPDVFYNIGYRAYSRNTKVESVTSETLRAALSLFNETGEKLLDENINSDWEEKTEKSIKPGESLVVPVIQTNSAVSKLMVRLLANDMIRH